MLEHLNLFSNFNLGGEGKEVLIKKKKKKIINLPREWYHFFS